MCHSGPLTICSGNHMRFPVFLLGLCLASLGAGVASLLLGWSGLAALGMAGATLVVGQLLYVGLIAMLMREETRTAPVRAGDQGAAGNSQPANNRAS